MANSTHGSNANNQSVQFNAHPLHTQMLDAWGLGRDSYGGEGVIKERGPLYLSPTSGMRADNYPATDSEGYHAYEAYLKRAVYPSNFEEAVRTAVGVMHRKQASIELPNEMRNLFQSATSTGEDIYMVLRRINSEQLITGRLGLLGLVHERDGERKPILIVHQGENVYNWDDTISNSASSNLRIVEIDESEYEMNAEFCWEYKTKARALVLVNAEGNIVNFDTDGQIEDGVFATAMLDSDSKSLAGLTFNPLQLQGQTIDRIPFTFINTKDLSSQPDKPPLDNLARICLAIYRGEADYRQNLFMQGQDTLVRIGHIEDDNKPVRTGAGAMLDVPANGDAKYIGVSGDGLSEQRSALETDYKRAELKASKLTNQGNGLGGSESGEALKVRVASQTATLPEIALTGAAGLEKVLRDLAVWMGADPDKVSVKPNLEFADVAGDGVTLERIMKARSLGAPLSLKSIHQWATEQKFTTLEYEAEMAAILSEAPDDSFLESDGNDDEQQRDESI